MIDLLTWFMFLIIFLIIIFLYCAIIISAKLNDIDEKENTIHKK